MLSCSSCRFLSTGTFTGFSLGTDLGKGPLSVSGRLPAAGCRFAALKKPVSRGFRKRDRRQSFGSVLCSQLEAGFKEFRSQPAALREHPESSNTENPV